MARYPDQGVSQYPEETWGYGFVFDFDFKYWMKNFLLTQFTSHVLCESFLSKFQCIDKRYHDSGGDIYRRYKDYVYGRC